MSDITCGNCDCVSKSQCMKKGNNNALVVEAEKSYVETTVMDIPAAENDGNCKCRASCTSANCTCACH